MNIIKDLVARWFNSPKGDLVLRVDTILKSGQLEEITYQLQSEIVMAVVDKIAEEIAERFLVSYSDIIKEKILMDKNFAAKVYNAIVLKVAKDYIQ